MAFSIPPPGAVRRNKSSVGRFFNDESGNDESGTWEGVDDDRAWGYDNGELEATRDDELSEGRKSRAEVRLTADRDGPNSDGVCDAGA